MMAEPMTPEDERRIAELIAMHPALLSPEAIELRNEVTRLGIELADMQGRLAAAAEETRHLRAELAIERKWVRHFREGRGNAERQRNAAREQVKHVRAELLAEESRMLDARDHVNPRAKSHLDAEARRLRALADGLDGTGAGS